MCEKNVRMSSSEWDEAWWENNPAVAGCHRFEVSSIAKTTEINKREDTTEEQRLAIEKLGVGKRLDNVTENVGTKNYCGGR